MVTDPLAAFQGLMATAPPSDRETIADPAWQEVFVLGMTEALRQGAEGWADESMRLFAEWDLRPEDVPTHVVWWHGRSDANAPLRAVERFSARMPSVDLRLFDVYRGQPVPQGKKSLAYALTFQAPDRTLTDEDVSKLRSKIVQRLGRELGATLRS